MWNFCCMNLYNTWSEVMSSGAHMYSLAVGACSHCRPRVREPLGGKAPHEEHQFSSAHKAVKANTLHFPLYFTFTRSFPRAHQTSSLQIVFQSSAQLRHRFLYLLSLIFQQRLTVRKVQINASRKEMDFDVSVIGNCKVRSYSVGSSSFQLTHAATGSKKQEKHDCCNFKFSWLFTKSACERVVSILVTHTLTFFAQETLPEAEAEGHDQQSCYCGDWDQDGESCSNWKKRKNYSICF